MFKFRDKKTKISKICRRFGVAALPIALSAKSENTGKVSRNKATMKRSEKSINSADEAALKELGF
ncbi:hypothetical protein CAMRE0001_3025 [Campylobacter rectus RM3267]|uniref:Uncharacterized protein n=2 Tax=Campylobacter rectus TaxID=203 RepID=A0A6G5QLU7_CAMRE|nr:hypothetical protein CAMRE0001_3025 [Campylobacter rectus RM3267]QCD46685.1 hypothetical protein CRECT_1017 [Campylobacter rectus]